MILFRTNEFIYVSCNTTFYARIYNYPEVMNALSKEARQVTRLKKWTAKEINTRSKLHGNETYLRFR